MRVSVGLRYTTTSPRTSTGKPTPLHLRRPMRTTPLHDALLAIHTDDAHCYLYFEPGEPTVTRHTAERPHPRFDALRIDTLFCDLDNPSPDGTGHVAWPDEATAVAAAVRARDLAQTAGVYLTTKGMRLVQPLERELPVLEADGAMRAWYAALDQRGLGVDHSTAQWHRSFRLPNVTRDRSAYRSPLVDLVRMRPVEPPAGAFVRRASVRGGPLVDVAELADLPSLWAEVARALQPVIEGEPVGGEDGRHYLSLRLVGAALRLGLRPEYARAFVLVAFERAVLGDVHEFRRLLGGAAHDTARAHVARRAVQGLRALF